MRAENDVGAVVEETLHEQALVRCRGVAEFHAKMQRNDHEVDERADGGDVLQNGVAADEIGEPWHVGGNDLFVRSVRVSEQRDADAVHFPDKGNARLLRGAVRACVRKLVAIQDVQCAAKSVWPSVQTVVVHGRHDVKADLLQVARQLVGTVEPRIASSCRADLVGLAFAGKRCLQIADRQVSA